MDLEFIRQVCILFELDFIEYSKIKYDEESDIIGTGNSIIYKARWNNIDIAIKQFIVYS